MTAHQEFVNQILEIEWDMFIRVKSDRPASCQSAPDNFKTIRGSIFDTWTDHMLAAYLNDLIVANEQGRNMLTEKYARMDNLIDPVPANPIIEKIVVIECKWQKEIQDNYPALYEHCCRRTDPTEDGSDFSVYLRSELQTYGNLTIGLYYENVKNADDSQKNLALDALQNLVQKSGYRDLAHAENQLGETMDCREQKL